MKAKKVIGLSLSDELLKNLDVRRGLVSRSTFVEHALAEGLRSKKSKTVNRADKADSDTDSDPKLEG